MIPVRNSISKLFIWNWNSHILLALFNFNLNLVIFSKRCKILINQMTTFDFTQPCLAPYLFIATKFLPGSLTDETACCCHPDTTNLLFFYLLWLQTRPLWELCHRYAVLMEVNGSQLCFFLVLLFVTEHYFLSWTCLQLNYNKISGMNFRFLCNIWLFFILWLLSWI